MTDALVTTSFGAALTPHQVAELINAAIGGAPFARSLTRATTSTGKLAWPTVEPSGWAWLEELQDFPELVVGDDVIRVEVRKLGGLLPISNEMVDDSTVNLTTWLRGALTDSISRDLDLGILHGTGDPQPDGIVAQADSVGGATLLAAVGAAVAEIGEAGGEADSLALSPTLYAATGAEVDSTGRPIWPTGVPVLMGLRLVQVPGLATPLCFDSRRVFLVLGRDPTIELSREYAFRKDALTVRVKARVTVGAPAKSKAIRKLAIEAE